MHLQGGESIPLGLQNSTPELSASGAKVARLIRDGAIARGVTSEAAASTPTALAVLAVIGAPFPPFCATQLCPSIPEPFLAHIFILLRASLSKEKIVPHRAEEVVPSQCPTLHCLQCWKISCSNQEVVLLEESRQRAADQRLNVVGMTDPQSATPASDDLKTALRKHGAVAALVNHIAGSKQAEQDTRQATQNQQPVRLHKCSPNIPLPRLQHCSASGSPSVYIVASPCLVET